MNKFLSAGGLTGLFGFAAAILTALGKNNAAGVVSDPNTLATVGVLVTGVSSIVAGLLPNKTKAAS